MRVYRTKWATIGIGAQTFTYREGVVPRLDCGVLIRWDCSILPQLLRRLPPPSGPKAERDLQAKAASVELPVCQNKLAHLTEEDPLIKVHSGCRSGVTYTPRTLRRCRLLPWLRGVAPLGGRSVPTNLVFGTQPALGGTPGPQQKGSTGSYTGFIGWVSRPRFRSNAYLAMNANYIKGRGPRVAP